MAESPDIDVRRLLEILQLFGDLQHRDSGGEGHRKYLLVAAIDFGTTFSGYAFSFTSNEDNIIMNKNWGSESGFLAHKTETSVLLTPEGEFKAFGSEASKTYADLEEGDAARHYYFHRFKMKLHTEKSLSKDTTIEDVNGKKLPALDIFAHAMRYLKDHMLNAIKLTVSRETTLENDDICWVLTVPAIWDDSAKQFMRQAAYKAEIASESKEGQLLIALEPEAAGIFCRRDPTLKQLVDINPGDRYMIVDCGGGTVDITVHGISENGKVKEVATASGGDWGGTKVDEEFLKLLDKIFGADIMARYKVEHPNEYLNLLNEFETKKRSTGPSDTEKVAVHLGFSFFQFYPQHKDGCTVQEAIKQYDSEQVDFSNGLIRISHSLMKSFFTPVIDSILAHLDQLLTQGEITPLKYMFMVGGFSESPILQYAVKEKFQGPCTVLIPEGCGLSIIKGAVMFGHNPSSIAARKSKYTYGTAVCVPFEPEHHPERLKERIDGKLVCTKVFSKFVEAGQLVAVGEVSEHSFSPASLFSPAMGIEIFRTKEKEVHYCDDEGVTKCGYVVVALPPPIPGLPRSVRATLTFSGTEIKVDAFALGNGERASTKIDFLQD
ncbi:HSPA12A [Branchiostoma lanceolatum]|uniref:HSPA12A protein n=1 Tax=Branchiostoma lanceolatum TaxID=7740 RepID=A0A8J9ZX80_BRALA|nr:HSPA12A [Branchiostoma lanceolatum]